MLMTSVTGLSCPDSVVSRQIFRVKIIWVMGTRDFLNVAFQIELVSVYVFYMCILLGMALVSTETDKLLSGK